MPSNGLCDGSSSARPRPTRTVRGRRWATTAGAALLLALAAAPLRADVVHLVGGGQIEGDVAEEAGGKVRVTLTSGAVVLDRADIERVEKAPSAVQRYEERKARMDNTAKGNLTLGAWCDQNGMSAKAREHYREAARLDPTLAAAYEALGYVPIGDAWLDGETIAIAPKPRPDAGNAEERLLREIVASWARRIGWIRRSYLEPGGGYDEKRFRDGRSRILAINDPLAIPALLNVLSEARYRSRRVLVEALGRFPHDEATLNLLVIAVVDPEPLVRSAAVTELIPRKDPRIVAELRKGLASDDEALIRRSATALGQLKAREAVGDLIDRLTQIAPVTVPVAREQVLLGYVGSFSRPTVVELGGRRCVHTPSIAVVDALVPIVRTTDVRYVRKTGVIYRTEVQDALTAITGQNFGFDVDAWKRWQKQNAWPPAPAPTTAPQ